MIETLVGVNPSSSKDPADRPSAEELAAARELVRQARAQGGRVDRPGRVVESADQDGDRDRLEEEIAEHLGYDKHDPAGRNPGQPGDLLPGRPARVSRSNWQTSVMAGRTFSGEDIAIIRPEEIRRLPERHALVIAENGKPIIARRPAASTEGQALGCSRPSNISRAELAERHSAALTAGGPGRRGSG